MNQLRQSLPQERKTLQQVRDAQLRQRQRSSCTVSRLCPGGTVVCLGAGPSLHQEDVDYAHAKGATIIAVNDAYRLAPFATALMASDGAWWIHKKPEFAGLRFSLDPAAARVPGVKVLRRTGEDGIETDPSALRTGRNSGAAAVNLAVHFLLTGTHEAGALSAGGRIILLGYDMAAPGGGKPTHFFGSHKFPLRNSSPYEMFREQFKKQVDPLKHLGIQIVNCSRQSALTCFPRRPLAEELP